MLDNSIALFYTYIEIQRHRDVQYEFSCGSWLRACINWLGEMMNAERISMWSAGMRAIGGLVAMF